MKTFRLVVAAIVCAIVCAIAIPAFAHSATEAKPHKAHFYYLRGVRMGTFAIGNDAQIQLGANHAAALGNLAVGQTAHLSYTIENGLLVAHKITVNVPHQKPAPSPSPEPKTASSHPSNNPNPESQEHHVHGLIAGINTAAGTITLRNPR